MYWEVVAHEAYPVWVMARRVIKSENIHGGRVRYLIEAGAWIETFPTSPKGLVSIRRADAWEIPAA